MTEAILVGVVVAEKVRARLVGAEPGRLSLTGTDEEGRLSRPGKDSPVKSDFKGD